MNFNHICLSMIVGGATLFGLSFVLENTMAKPVVAPVVKEICGSPAEILAFIAEKELVPLYIGQLDSPVTNNDQVEFWLDVKKNVIVVLTHKDVPEEELKEVCFLGASQVGKFDLESLKKIIGERV